MSNPWDLAVVANNLFIAMPGTHQIWKMPLDESVIGPYAGNSREDEVDGPLLPRQPWARGFASFAQPSGLAADSRWLYVADSEGSSVRAVPPRGSGDVRTVIGTSAMSAARLFTFGDVNGENPRARFQHPIGIACHDGLIYLADTYNNKIKVIDPAKHSARTLAGSGRAGYLDSPPAAAQETGQETGQAAGQAGGAAEFNEPAGLAYAAGKLYVADTNNHRIRVVTLGGDNSVGTLPIAGLAPPEAVPQRVAGRNGVGSAAGGEPKAAARPDFSGAQPVQLSPARIKAVAGAIHLAVKFHLPAGFKINAQTPMRLITSKRRGRPARSIRPLWGNSIRSRNRRLNSTSACPSSGRPAARRSSSR